LNEPVLKKLMCHQNDFLDIEGEDLRTTFPENLSSRASMVHEIVKWF